MFVLPEIIELTPQNTIVITSRGGSITGQSEPYGIIIDLDFSSSTDITVVWEMTILNGGFYRFENRQSLQTGTAQVPPSNKRITVPFSIQNIGDISSSTPNLELQVSVYEEKSGSSNRQSDLVTIQVSFEPTKVLDRKMLI